MEHKVGGLATMEQGTFQIQGRDEVVYIYIDMILLIFKTPWSFPSLVIGRDCLKAFCDRKSDFLYFH